MKPFQFYEVEFLPELDARHPVQSVIQQTLDGEDEPVGTTVELEKGDFEPELSLLRIKSSVRHDTHGFVKRASETGRTRIEFSVYFEPVDFFAYLYKDRSKVIFQAPKKTCRSVYLNLRSTSDMKLKELEVNFDLLFEKCNQFYSAWFRGVSTRVDSANVTGKQVQDDPLFNRLRRDGVLSNVTIPWMMDGTEHRVMITQAAAVVLVQDYQQNMGLELAVVQDVYRNLLQHVTEAKVDKRRRTL